MLKAITLAGGTTDRAAQKRVQVIRTDKNGTRVTLEVNLKRIKRGKAEDPILQKDDVVLVPESFLLMKDSSIVDGLDLQHYWRILVRRRWVIFLVVFALGLFSLVGSFLTTPRYKATTRLQIERHLPDILNIQEVARPDFYLGFEHFYQTQYEIHREHARRTDGGRAAGIDRALRLLSAPTGSRGSSPGLKKMLPRKARPKVELDPIDLAARRLQANLEVLPVAYSYLVDVSWSHTDPKFAAEVTNTIADSYIAFSLPNPLLRRPTRRRTSSWTRSARFVKRSPRSKSACRSTPRPRRSSPSTGRAT